MKEFILIIFAAGLVYFVVTRVTKTGLIFKLKKEQKTEKTPENIAVTPEGATVSALEEGQSLFNRGDLDGAEKKFIEALKENANSGTAYHFLGMIYLRQKMYQGAVETLKKAVEIDPLNDTAFNNLGLSYYNLDDFENSVFALERSISLNDKIGHRYLNLALSHQQLKNYDKAAIALEASANIHADTENLTLLAKNYMKMGDKKLTKKTLERLLECDPGNSWAKRQLSS